MKELTFKKYDGGEIIIYDVNSIRSIATPPITSDPNASSYIHTENSSYHIVGNVATVKEKIRIHKKETSYRIVELSTLNGHIYLNFSPENFIRISPFVNVVTNPNFCNLYMKEGEGNVCHELNMRPWDLKKLLFPEGGLND